MAIIENSERTTRERLAQERLLQELELLRQSKILVIVEGIKDRRALQEFGIRDIAILNKPLYKVAEDIASKKAKECAILTDLDSEGKKLYGMLNKELSRLGIKSNNRFRRFLHKSTALRQLEGLVKYLNH